MLGATLVCADGGHDSTDVVCAPPAALGMHSHMTTPTHASLQVVVPIRARYYSAPIGIAACRLGRTAQGRQRRRFCKHGVGAPAIARVPLGPGGRGFESHAHRFGIGLRSGWSSGQITVAGFNGGLREVLSVAPARTLGSSAIVKADVADGTVPQELRRK